MKSADIKICTEYKYLATFLSFSFVDPLKFLKFDFAVTLVETNYIHWLILSILLFELYCKSEILSV